MKVVLAVLGTRGDLQPLLALGIALRERGHEVVVCSSDEFAAAVRQLDFRFEGFGMELAPHLRLGGGFRTVRRLAAHSDRMFAVVSSAARGASVIVHAMLEAAAPSVAEALGIPLVNVVYSPTLLRSEEHLAIVGQFGDRLPPRWFNRLFWRSIRWAWNKAYREPVNVERLRLGLAPIGDAHHYLFQSGCVLLAADRELAPLPVHLESEVTATGFWYLDRHDPLSPEIEAFLSAGSAPVYIGFGSMRQRDDTASERLVLAALSDWGGRAVLGPGLGVRETAAPSGTCLPIANAPHAALFPRVAAVVHHGGAGTFAAAARAGVPQVVVPHLGDQNYWGQRVHALGLGPKPLFRPFLSRRRLAEAIREVSTHSSFRDAARRLAPRLESTNGVDKAVAIVLRIAGLAPSG